MRPVINEVMIVAGRITNCILWVMKTVSKKQSVAIKLIKINSKFGLISPPDYGSICADISLVHPLRDDRQLCYRRSPTTLPLNCFKLILWLIEASPSLKCFMREKNLTHYATMLHAKRFSLVISVWDSTRKLRLAMLQEPIEFLFSFFLALSKFWHFQ